MGKLFTNEKEIKRAIKAAVDQARKVLRIFRKYEKFSGWCTYINKKGHVQVKSFNNGKIVHERKRN